MKRLFRFPVLSNYLEKGPEYKLARLQDTSSAAGGLREGVATRGGLVGGVKAESSGNIYFPYQFLHGELECPHTHTTGLGSTAKFKARITRISEIFYRTRPKDAAMETVIRTCMYIAMK